MPILSEAPFTTEKEGAVVFTFGQKFPFTVVDRMLTESCWSKRGSEDYLSNKMIVFYSIKGGVGCSTALAATAWHFAQLRKKVMVVDMNFESPGISNSLLPKDYQPDYGILDWLVEDVVRNGDEILDHLFALSPLANGSQGNIVVIPAHGKKYNDYIVKMERAWMHRIDGETRISWPQRLHNLLQKLDEQHHPDCILIDSQSGINEAASVSVLDLAPKLVLFFVLDNIQTWIGSSILFDHWKNIGQAQNIRTSLQIVAAMVPPLENQYSSILRLRENAWNFFAEKLYDNLTEKQYNLFNFDCDSTEAPHTPWIIYRHQDLLDMKYLYTLENTLNAKQIYRTFPFLTGLGVYFFS